MTDKTLKPHIGADIHPRVRRDDSAFWKLVSFLLFVALVVAVLTTIAQGRDGDAVHADKPGVPKITEQVPPRPALGSGYLLGLPGALIIGQVFV